VPWSLQRAAVCDVTYALNRERIEMPCARTFDPGRRMREAPATMIQGAQLLVGRFRNDRLAVALADACFERNPAVFDPEDIAGQQIGSFKPVVEVAQARTGRIRLQRTIKCSPLTNGEEIGRETTLRGIPVP
jgi:hypothetical protein